MSRELTTRHGPPCDDGRVWKLVEGSEPSAFLTVGNAGCGTRISTAALIAHLPAS
jgi:hypothetical protein